MDNKIIVIIIATLLGGATGFGVSYATFNSPIETLQSSVSTVADEQTSLDTSVTNLNTTVTNLGTSLTLYENDLDEVTSMLDEVNSTLYSLPTEWTEFDYNSLNTTFHNLLDLVSDMQNNVSDVQEGIVDLRNDLTAVNTTINEIEARHWHLVYNFSNPDGNSGEWTQNSTLFNIQGRAMTIDWIVLSKAPSAGQFVVQIRVYFSNGTLYDEIGSASWMQETHIFTDETVLFGIPTGNYYLQMYANSYLNDYSLTIDVMDFY